MQKIKTKDSDNTSTLSKIIIYALEIILVLVVIAVILLLFGGISSSNFLQGHFCIPGSTHIICSRNINYASNGQISISIRQETGEALYNVKFSCLGAGFSYNSENATYTGTMVGYNSIFPNNILLYVKNIQCYYANGTKITIGPGTYYEASLWMRFEDRPNTSKLYANIGQVIIGIANYSLP